MDKVAVGPVCLPVRQIISPLQTARIVKKQFRSVGIVVTWVNVRSGNSH
jgi:hypothetical protein